MENMTFYDFITFVIDFVEVRFLIKISFQLPESQKKT